MTTTTTTLSSVLSSVLSSDVAVHASIIAGIAGATLMFPSQRKLPSAGDSPGPSTAAAPLSRVIDAWRVRDQRWVSRVQSAVRRPWLDTYMSFVTQLGHEDFYVGSLAFLLFATPLGALATRLMVLLPCAIVVANALKNAFAVPRPDPRCVWTGGTRPEPDFGFPSTHAMNSVSLPGFSAAWIAGGGAAAMHSAGAAEVAAVLLGGAHLRGAAVAALAFWSAQLSLSRVYLGVHSPADIAAGVTLGAGLLAVFAEVQAPLFAWAADPSGSVGSAALWLLAAASMALKVHPEAAPKRTYGESACMAGVAVGTLVGVRAHAVFIGGPPLDGFRVATSASDSWTIAVALARFVCWAPVLFAILAGGKFVIGVPLAALLRAVGAPHVPYGALEFKGASMVQARVVGKKGGGGTGGTGGADGSRAKKGKGAKKAKQDDAQIFRGFRVDSVVRVLTYAAMTFAATFVLPALCPAGLR